MNEPRSQAELYIVVRETTDGSKQYNISYNPANDLQTWIEDMAAYVKSLDPIHLLSTGQEGFAGNSTPLYMYSNPGAWASLLGVDFVRNNKAKGIDYATMHVYVDQWLCVQEGSTTAGQLDFMKTWIEVRQQAAEEDLEMPVVLEEFGCKLNARPDQYKLAYDSCLTSAKRGGSCAGVMFWDLAHKAFEPLDPYLDGILRFGGGYSNMLGATGQSDTASFHPEQRNEVFDYVRSYAKAVDAINAASQGTATCVFVPPPQAGLGCKDLSVNWDEGGMPWTCLPGEPADINWCNDPGGWDLYKNPPQAWIGADDHGLPYNTIEVLVLGNVTNTGNQPLNLKNSWIIIPFSMGVQTEFEGIWKRIDDPNNYFQIFCWLVTDSNGDDLCTDGLRVDFTNFTWPTGVKQDRGFNISFTKDVILPPNGGWAGGKATTSSADIALSFKDNKNAYRLDVSSLGLRGSLDCPNSTLHASWPPPPPPLPKPCTEGPDSRRGCPHFEWFYSNTTLNQDEKVSTASLGRRLQQGANFNTPPPPAHLPLSAVQMGLTPAQAGLSSGYFGSGPFTTVLNSTSPPISASVLGLKSGPQFVVLCKVSASGAVRKPRSINMPNAQSVGNPHPDATGINKAAGIDVLLVLQYTRKNLSGPTYMALGRTLVVPGNGSQFLRGVFTLEPEADLATASAFLETPHPGITLTYEQALKAYLASDLSDPAITPSLPDGILDAYRPCTIDPIHGYSLVYEVELPHDATSDDQLSIQMCSEGGYDQELRVYENGKQTATNTPTNGSAVWTLTVPVKNGSRYILAQQADLGDPYGGYRGQPGLRLKWLSGQAFAALYDAAPTHHNASQFLRINGNDFVIDCKRAAYVGCNTWDLMDKSRDVGARPEVQARLDAMKTAGWDVGRTWGFSLGTGLVNSPVGQVVADPTKILETAPGVYNEDVFSSLDWILDQASQRGLRIILPFEDYWLSLDRYINWSSTAKSTNDFYTDWQCRQAYKDHIEHYVNRRNTYNGRLYKEDPTIFYWDLINEPRCTSCGFALQQWIEEMGVHLKAIDPNHLVTIGEEGFYSTTCERAFMNPGAGKRRTGISSSPWAAQEGQDFLANHVVPSIDLITTHIWSDNWMGYADFAGSKINEAFDYTHGNDLWKEKLDYTNAWLSAHISDANALGKPLVVEEFGKAKAAAKVYTGEFPHGIVPGSGERIQEGNSVRDLFMKAIYDQIWQNLKNGGVTQGSNFWNLYTAGIGDDDPYQITLADTSTVGIIDAHAAEIATIAGNQDAGCTTTDGTNSNAASFPGYKPGDWATPPGPPAPEMAGFTPVQFNTSTPMDSAGGFTGTKGNRAGSYEAQGNPSITIDGIMNAPPPPTPGIFGAGH
ncbi:hypothetical protein CVIRNUC_008361 [Coccomyxa viridis]|uniref:mannan endo-1,4-beta-mannosidase n=1 Tax=Coccomyxa viridis TaxID=1274662 RepID=A0AAV1IFD0_9CHLO|nr:hypothetical protein CVIRNUC_008361 [Coccomyxa viridis]